VARTDVTASEEPTSPASRCSSGYLFFLNPGNPSTLVLLSLSMYLSSMHLRFQEVGKNLISALDP
jgi:hypothetical protein